MFKIITPVAVEPVSIAEVKQHLRLPDEDLEDDLLQALITAARVYSEDYTRRAFAEQTLELLLDRFPVSRSIDLPCPPLQSVTSIKFKDSKGVEKVLSTERHQGHYS